MKIESMLQGSEKWLIWRQNHIVGTDIAVVCRVSPYKTPLQLWEEKLSLKEPEPFNSKMARGQSLESEARILASNIIGIDFQPAVYESDKYPMFGVSLDGISLCEKYLLEVKCLKESSHQESINGVIQEYYKYQCQWQLMVTGAEICYYFSYRPERNDAPYAIIEVYPDLEKQQEIIAKGQEFYINMCTMNPPIEWQLEIRPEVK